MATQQQALKNSGAILSHNESGVKDEGKEEELYRSVLTAFQQKEEEIERKKVIMKEKVAAQLGRAQEETKRLAEIREVLIVLGKIGLF